MKIEAPQHVRLPEFTARLTLQFIDTAAILASSGWPLVRAEVRARSICEVT
jgi:hypothetical protein